MSGRTKFTLVIALFAAATIAPPAAAQISGGGQYTIEQSAIAGGGAVSSGGQFTLGGTIGQAVAGQKASNAAFSVHAGFWNGVPLAPTAAEVTVGGRVTTADGRGIRNVRVTMTGAGGETRTAISTAFGYFQFTDVPAGETFVFSVAARRFRFSQPTRVCTILEDTNDIVFVAEEFIN